MACSCTDKELCKEACELWELVEDSWETFSKLRDYRPRLIDAYLDSMADFREHRREHADMR
jgi:hypothetical protein